MPSTDPLLDVSGLRSAYGRIEALHGVSVSVHAGEIVALVGGNGAGKTTLLRSLSGVQPVTGGEIRFEGRDISRLSPHARVAARVSLPSSHACAPRRSTRTRGTTPR